jgi:hypothetical protein
MAFRLGMELRRGRMGALAALEDKGEGDAGRTRGAKNGTLAALREFGGSSE